MPLFLLTVTFKHGEFYMPKTKKAAIDTVTVTVSVTSVISLQLPANHTLTDKDIATKALRKLKHAYDYGDKAADRTANELLKNSGVRYGEAWGILSLDIISDYHI